MAVTATPIFVQAPKLAITAYTTASGTVTHVTGGTNGSKISSLTAVSNSTSAHVFTVALSSGGTAVTLGAVSIPASAGTDGSTPGIDIFSAQYIPGLPVDGAGQPYVTLPSTLYTMTVVASATINTGKQVSIVSVYGDY